MNAIIIEDEGPAARKLEKLLKQVSRNIEIEAVLESVADSIEWFSDNSAPDLIFSDIQLADALSFDIFEQMPLKCPIIFTTAYDEYAIRAFKHHSLDYLLKPIKLADIEGALQKFDDLKLLSQNAGFEDVLRSLADKEYKERFLVKHGKKYISVPVSEIAYFYSDNGISFIKTFTDSRYMMNDTLDTVEKMIAPKLFFRANRQFIVNISAVLSFETYFNQKLTVKISPAPASEVLISKTKATSFKEWMGF